MAANESRERIGNVSDLRQAMEPSDQGGQGVALGMLLSIGGFAQEATRIPPVASADGAAGVTPEGQIVCACGGGVTDLELGRLVACVADCGRYFTGTANKAFSFGPWVDALEDYETVEVDGHEVPLLRRAA